MYDSVEYWHEQQPPGTPEDALMAPAALWLAWLSLNGMVTAGEGETAAMDAALRARSITPLQWYWERSGNAFYPEDLTTAGQRLTERHYVSGHVRDDADDGDDETEPGPCFDDLEAVFEGLVPWEIPGDWDSFDRIASGIAASHVLLVNEEPE